MFEYFVVEHKNCNNFDFSFLMKNLIRIFTMARFTSIKYSSSSSNNSQYAVIIISYHIIDLLYLLLRS